MSAKRSSAPPPRRLAAGSAAPRLRERRRAARRRLFLAVLLLLLFVGALGIWGLNQPAVRISSIEIEATENLLPGPAPLDLANAALRGSHVGLIPYDSTFFLNAPRVRALIRSAHPEIAALSLRHTGLRSIAIRISPRTALGRWCGLAPAPGVAPYCYLYDPSGFLYAALPDPLAGASSTPVALPDTLNDFSLYAPLAGNAQEPLGATIARAAELPGAFAFARRLADLGSPIAAVFIRGDEVDDLLASGTRVTYVLGREEEAFSALISAKRDLDLSNGSLEYVDLRFSGKVYLKERGGG